jgi:RNase P/RNase MRP subunit POP5
MKQRRRYVVLEVGCNSDGADIFREVVHLSRPFGLDTSKIKLIFHDPVSKKCVIRCSHKQVDMIKLVIAGSKRIPIQVTGVSGTVSVAKRKFLSEPQKG